MGSWRTAHRAAARTGLALAAIAVMAPGLAHAAAVDLFYERTVMAAADARCRLFKPEISRALGASRAQARNAALRAGIDSVELARVEARARSKAGAEPCGSAALATVAARVRDAFDGYSRLQKMAYPGDHQDWTAERVASRAGRVWALSQQVPFGRDALTFGLAGQAAGHELMAVAIFTDGAQPYAARIVMRDPARAQKPFLDFRRAAAGQPLPLAGRITPRSATRAFLAEAKMAPDPLLNPAKAKGAIAYRFPPEAARALSELDPREAVEVEFLFASRSGQDVVRRGYVEVGDFAAGMAFLAAGGR
jgi:hypothetical protein